MYLFKLLMLLAGLYESQQSQKHNTLIFKSYEHRKTSHRILELMRSYYEEATARITHLNPLRFMYEESPHYEIGYIIGEIIERYRKVVENTQKPIRFKSYTLMDIMKHVELNQKLYFELYHLVRMVHETPRKWRDEAEFADIEKIVGPEILGGRGIDGKGKKYVILSEVEMSRLYAIQQAIMERERHRLKEKRRQKRKNDKLREAFLQGIITEMKGPKKSFFKRWPLDYGWEIEGDF